MLCTLARSTLFAAAAVVLLVACGAKPNAGQTTSDGALADITRDGQPPASDTLPSGGDSQPVADTLEPPSSDAPPAADAPTADATSAADTTTSADATPAADTTPSADASPATAGCTGKIAAQRTYTLTITHGGRQRSAIVHLPPAYDGNKPLPLVFNNHGNLHSAKLQADMSGLDARADTRDVITVTPQGTGLLAGWNVGNSPIGNLYSNVDDVGFFGALLDELERTRCVDKKRVYCTGFSLGGSMCYRLACEMSDRIAAFSSVAGPDGTKSCSPKRPLSLLHIHGTADNFAGYNADGGLNKGVQGYVPAHAKRAGCGASTSVTLTKGAVVCKRFAGCPSGVEVGYCDVNGFGHSWPGGKGWLLSGPVNQDIDASAMILDYLLKHSL